MAETRAVTLRAKQIRRPNYRYMGFVTFQDQAGQRLRLPMPGTVAQWLETGSRYRLTLLKEERPGFDDYILGGTAPIWPLFQRTYTLERRSPKSGQILYRYRLLAREARYEKDYEAIVDLEQYHYASDEEILATWYCERCHIYLSANARPTCPECGDLARFHDLKSATRASRFLVIHLLEREPYEPEVVAYVRVDPPVPLLSRRLPDGSGEPHMRERIFPPEWFAHPFRPREDVPPEEWWREQGWALQRTRSPVSRLARVVVHPDYRVDGLGRQCLQAMVDWVQERWIPEMREEKQAIETIAMMARYNPFLERFGFTYLFDSRSGRPVLYFPLSDTARQAIQTFLETDPLAREHGGRLYHPRFQPVDPLDGPIRLQEVTKSYTNRLTLEHLSEPVRALLEAFGVRQRLIQKTVVREASATLEPGSVTVLVGASGSGKTTLLRLLIGAATDQPDPLYQPDSGQVILPGNAQVQAFLPGELEPDYGDLPIVEALFRITGDEGLAVEVLNYSGISDAVFYRATFRELSTGQKERARIAWLVAHRPNLLLVDEFTAHLDPTTAIRVARKLAQLAREKGLTLILVTHRPEVLKVLEPDRLFMVGYGTFFEPGALPERGFRVLEPYATYLVEGKKSWELRRRPTRIRGRVGVISGDRVLGTVELRDVHGPFQLEELQEHWDKHLADQAFLERYARGDPLYAWEVTRPQKFVTPVPVRIKPGHQTWVRLEPARSASTPEQPNQERSAPESTKESTEE